MVPYNHLMLMITHLIFQTVAWHIGMVEKLIKHQKPHYQISVRRIHHQRMLRKKVINTEVGRMAFFHHDRNVHCEVRHVG